MTTSVHTLTTVVLPLDDGTWRIVATCSCLGFGRKATCATPTVAEHGRLMVADYHRAHVAAVAAGRELPEQRPSWLPAL